jgi:small-conductance mechanosensitive channel
MFLHIEFYSKIRDISGFCSPSSGFSGSSLVVFVLLVFLLLVFFLLLLWYFGTSGLSFSLIYTSCLLVWVWVNYTARRFLMIIHACWVSDRLRRQALEFFNKKITSNPHYFDNIKKLLIFLSSMDIFGFFDKSHEFLYNLSAYSHINSY